MRLLRQLHVPHIFPWITSTEAPSRYAGRVVKVSQAGNVYHEE